ncbi:hypothetical protein [Lacrimispora sp.]|uniref:hypothetical protein n=1 Tax=Lacrimispora sp. TaxID=2719234 RepID=UPI0028B03231|nr:hypothetical protein [Lacrimispora sp.]
MTKIWGLVIGDLSILEIISIIVTALLAFLTLQLYIKQVRFEEHDRGPQFNVKIVSGIPGSTEELTDAYDQYLEISNNGKAIDNKEIETAAVLNIGMTKNENSETLKGICYKVDDFFTSFYDQAYLRYDKTGIISRKSTSFHYSQIMGKIYGVSQEINDTNDEDKFQVYETFDYYVKISYIDFDGNNKENYFRNEHPIGKAEYEKVSKFKTINANQQEEGMKEIKNDLLKLKKNYK